MFSNLKLWSWNMRWAFTRSSEAIKQPVLFHAVTRSRGVANLLFTLAPDVSFQRALLIHVKLRAYLQSSPFLRSTIYPANFGTFNWHLELVPSGISPFLVFFWPSIRRYLSGTHNWLIYRFSQGWKRSLRFYTYHESNQIEVITWTLSQKTEILTSLRAFGIGHL